MELFSPLNIAQALAEMNDDIEAQSWNDPSASNNAHVADYLTDLNSESRNKTLHTIPE